MPPGTKTESNYPGHSERFRAFIAWIQSYRLHNVAGEEVCQFVLHFVNSFPETLMMGDAFEDVWHKARTLYLDLQQPITSGE